MQVLRYFAKPPAPVFWLQEHYNISNIDVTNSYDSVDFVGLNGTCSSPISVTSACSEQANCRLEAAQMSCSPRGTTNGLIHRPSDRILTKLFDMEDEASEKRINELELKLAAKEAELEERGGNMHREAEAVSHVVASQKHISDLKEELSAKDREINVLGDSLTTMQGIMKKRLNAQESQLNMTVTTLQTLQAEVEQKDAMLVELEAALADSKCQLAAVTSENEKLTLHHKQASRENWKLQSLLARSKREQARCVQCTQIERVESAVPQGETSSEVFRQSLQSQLQIGDVEAILTWIRMHRDRQDYMEEVCRAIGKLASSKRTEIANHGGIHQILGCMETNPTHSGVQAAGCLALKSLATTADLRLDIASAGSFQTICEAMENHKHENLVLEQATAALLAICWSEKEIQHRVSEELGVDRIESAISHLATSNNSRFWGEQLVQLLRTC